MASTFFGLNIAASGLRAANANLNATANNVANATTDGYSRQKVNQVQADALRVFASYGSAGAGVETISIERVRDAFYDAKYRTNETELGEYSQKNYYNALVEKYYEDDGISGFNTLFGKMQANLQSILTNQGTLATKETFIGSMTSLTEYFNTTSNYLQQMQTDINDEVKLTCDTINAIAQKIVSMNQQINTVEQTGTVANDLRDKRDMLIDELSSLVSVEIKEVKVLDDNNPNRDTGVTRMTIHIAGGQLLLDDDHYNQLICVARGQDDAVNQSDVTGLYDIKWATAEYEKGTGFFTGTFDLYNPHMGGKLQGLLEMRDGNNGQYFHGSADAASGVTTNADGTRTLTVKVGADYLKDMAKCALAEDGNITVGSRTYSFSSWAYDGDETYTFALDGSLTAEETARLNLDVSRGADVKVGELVQYYGVPYYQAQMNEWIRNFSANVNECMVNGYTSDSGEGSLLLTGGFVTDSNAQYTYDDLTTTTKQYYHLTAANFDVSRALKNDSSQLAVKADKTEGTGEVGNAEKLKDVLDRNNIFRNATAGDFLDKILTDVTMNMSTARTMEQTYSALQVTIDNQRLSVSGVDKDEEAVSLVEYQNYYTLASKMIQTLTEIYDRLILQTGV